METAACNLEYWQGGAFFLDSDQLLLQALGPMIFYLLHNVLCCVLILCGTDISNHLFHCPMHSEVAGGQWVSDGVPSDTCGVANIDSLMDL